jgi:hypothetical protein
MKDLEKIIEEWSNVKNWKYGFYFSSIDVRLYVPKKSGLGWTPNLANFRSVLLLILFVVVACTPILLYMLHYVNKFNCAFSEIFIIAFISVLLNRLSSIEFYLK